MEEKTTENKIEEIRQSLLAHIGLFTDQNKKCHLDWCNLDNKISDLIKDFLKEHGSAK